MVLCAAMVTKTCSFKNTLQIPSQGFCLWASGVAEADWPPLEAQTRAWPAQDGAELWRRHVAELPPASAGLAQRLCGVGGAPPGEGDVHKQIPQLYSCLRKKGIYFTSIPS